MTLGCRLNQADSALLNDRLIRLGFQIVPPDASSSPNLIFINSCTVTETAYKKSKQALRSIRAENPQSFIVFTGCAADVSRDELERNQDIDLVLTNEQKKNIETILPEYLALLDGALLGSYSSLPTLFKELNWAINEFSPEFITIYYGKDVSSDDAAEAEGTIAGCFPDAEVNLVDGGQPVYYYMISVE